MSDVSGSDVCRLRIEFDNNEIDWEHPLDLNGRTIKAIYVNDERIRECYACSKLAELIGENNALHVKVVDLTAERDQWREAAGNAHEMWEQADNERIKLAEQLEASMCADLGGIGANGEKVFRCSKCGCILSLYDSDGMNTLCTSFISDYPRFCPECGARIRRW